MAVMRSRMAQELKQLQASPPPGVCAWPVEDKLNELEAQVCGPSSTVYEGGVFKLSVHLPDRYPFEPPKVVFITPVHHPNIDNGGRICLDILNMPPKGAWRPSLNVSTVLASIGVLLSEPNPDDGLMPDVTQEYKHDRATFDAKARQMTRSYAVCNKEKHGTDATGGSAADAETEASLLEGDGGGEGKVERTSDSQDAGDGSEEAHHVVKKQRVD